MEQKREHLKSRLGFILLSAGCAIGCGNVWKFPTITGAYGGGAFVLLYLIFLVILGLPVMTMEFSVGRAAQKSPIRLYHTLTPKKKVFRVHGYTSLLGNLFLMMFYVVVAGWMVSYFVSSVSGDFTVLSTVDKLTAAQMSKDIFTANTANPIKSIGYTFLVVVAGFFICSFKLDKGLENVTKYMMVILLVLMIGLAVYSCTLSGAGEGVSYYLIPDFGRLIGEGGFESFMQTVVAAMNQAFFTLSLGIGSMAIFGSYIDKDRSLMGESVNVIVLDTLVAIVAGLIIFPACKTYGVDVGGGPSLIFETLPLVFANLPYGQVIGSLFFVFMTFAAFSTVLAVFENIIACFRDMFGWDRQKACFFCCGLMLILCLPCALSFVCGTSFGVLDIEDFIVSTVLLPLGSLIFVIFCTSKFGWGWDNFILEANTGKGLKVKKWMKVYMTYILPLIIIALFVYGVITFNYQGDIFSFFA